MSGVTDPINPVNLFFYSFRLLLDKIRNIKINIKILLIFSIFPYKGGGVEWGGLEWPRLQYSTDAHIDPSMRERERAHTHTHTHLHSPCLKLVLLNL